MKDLLFAPMLIETSEISRCRVIGCPPVNMFTVELFYVMFVLLCAPKLLKAI